MSPTHRFREMLSRRMAEVHELARSYTEAWCSRDPARVAAHYAPGGLIEINGGEPAPIEEVAASFIAAFPDIEVFMDDLVVGDGAVEYRWTFTGTSSETGNAVRISGREEWALGPDGLIASSIGRYDEAEYERQLYR
jgi:nuclear transport factor 2 (NTF2) superfamily protein